MGLTTFENSAFLLLFSAAAIHSLFLCILLLAKSRQERGLSWLGILMIPVGLWLLNYLFYLTGIIKSNPHLFGILGPALYLMAPIFYFFTVRATNSAHRFRWYDLLHLLPACYVLLEWWPIFGWTAEAKLAAIERMQSHGHPTLFQLLRANRLPLLILAYVLGAYAYLKMRLSHASANPLRILWLKRFTALFAAVLISFIFLPFIFIELQWLNAALVEVIFVLILVISIHSLGYVVLGRDKVLPEEILAGTAKYSTSPLSYDQIAAQKEAIVRFMENDRPWLDSKFSIGDLAQAMNIPRHHISQILNEGLQQNFSELICQYRVAEIKRRFEKGDAERYSILGIAQDCGFGSKSSFNRAFKRVLGMTPMEWLQASQLSDVSSEPKHPAAK